MIDGNDIDGSPPGLTFFCAKVRENAKKSAFSSPFQNFAVPLCPILGYASLRIPDDEPLKTIQYGRLSGGKTERELQ
jgi:hypothetical protein